MPDNSKYTISPQLTVADKAGLKAYLARAFTATDLCYDSSSLRYALPKMHLYTATGSIVLKYNTYWHVDNNQIYVGEAAQDTKYKDRLMVLLALCQFIELDAPLEKKIKTAIVRFLAGEFQEVNQQQIVVAKVPMKGMAVNEKTAEIACLFTDDWMLPNGQPVDVTKEGWDVAATAMPEKAPLETVAEAVKEALATKKIVAEGF